MTSPPDGPGVALDVAALRGAAELLRSSAPALAEATGVAGRSVDDAVPATGSPALAGALEEFARRWAEGVASVPRRVDGYGVLLRASVEAHVAADEAAAAGLAPPPR